MAKISAFTTLGRRYPKFRNLSANRFSNLNRMEEIYPIVRQLRADYPAAIKEFPNYPTISTKELGRKIFNFVQNSLV